MGLLLIISIYRTGLFLIILFRNFEITVNGKLVHSKKTKGHGFLHTNAEQQEIVYKAIEDAKK